jgi:hypothetical protein
MTWLKRILSSENELSSKRFIAFTLVLVKIISLFLLMYFKIEIANRELVSGILDNMFWLILIFGGFIAAEPMLKHVKLGGPKNIVTQDVTNQTVINEPADTNK